MSRDRRVRRDQPYLDEHRASEIERRKSPRNLSELLAWFLIGFRDETPEQMHVHDVWATTRRLDGSGKPTEAVPAAEQGGSQLGSPRFAEPFRQLLENTPRQWTDEGGTTDAYYVRPMRAAIARLAGRNPEGEAALLARYLLQVAYAAGDWRSVASRWGMLAPETTTEAALRRLYRLWRADPPLSGPTWVDYSDAQRAAIRDAEPRDGGVAA